MKKAVLFLILFYQKYLSTLKPRTCRFYPTCSQYAYQAVNKFGVIKGLILSIKRILRCNPFYEGGYDPLPEKIN